MNHGSLFSGIGGFDYASEQMGWTNIFHCEINPFCQSVLKDKWPNSDSLSDITKTDFKKYANRIDILTGGFPCQPYSQAGKRLGKDDERHLWPQMLRAIREIKPPWIVGENVRGLINWNRGVVFDEVQTDLESEGYEVLPLLLPACAVNAPHRRDRIWFVAYSGDQGFQRGEKHRGFEKIGKETNKQFTGYVSSNWQNFPTQSPVCDGNDGFPYELLRQQLQSDCNGNLSEKEINQIFSKAFNKWREESIKAMGNAVVPPLVLQIFKSIEKFNQL